MSTSFQQRKRQPGQASTGLSRADTSPTPARPLRYTLSRRAFAQPVLCQLIPASATQDLCSKPRQGRVPGRRPLANLATETTVPHRPAAATGRAFWFCQHFHTIRFVSKQLRIPAITAVVYYHCSARQAPERNAKPQLRTSRGWSRPSAQLATSTHTFASAERPRLATHEACRSPRYDDTRSSSRFAL